MTDEEWCIKNCFLLATLSGTIAPKKGIFAKAFESKGDTSEWLYIPTSRVTGRIDRAMICNEMSVILKRAWEITKAEAEASKITDQFWFPTISRTLSRTMAIVAGKGSSPGQVPERTAASSSPSREADA